MNGDRPLRRLLIVAAVAVLVLCALAGLDSANAAFVAATGSESNDVAALTIEPPTNVDAAMTGNVLPLLTCRVDLSWDASSTPGIDGYEIVRVDAGTTVIDAGPWTTTLTSFTDTPVPLQLIGSSYDWLVRTTFGSWTSQWAVATPVNLAACLL